MASGPDKRGPGKSAASCVGALACCAGSRSRRAAACCPGLPACAGAGARGAGAVVTLGNQDGAPRAAHEPERPAPPPADYLSGTHWPPAQIGQGKALISCSYDYDADGDGTPVTSLDFLELVDALTPCRGGDAGGTGLVRLR